MAPNGRKKPPTSRHYGSSIFVRHYEELKLSNAYISLSHTGQLVLDDWLYHWSLATDFDSREPDHGVPFAYSQCRKDLSKPAFYKARLELMQHGFIRRRRQGPGQRTLFKASTRWMKVTEDELPTKKAERLARVRTRIDLDRRSSIAHYLQRGIRKRPPPDPEPERRQGGQSVDSEPTAVGEGLQEAIDSLEGEARAKVEY